MFVYAWVQHEFLPGIVDKKMIAGSSAASDPNRHRALERSAAASLNAAKYQQNKLIVRGNIMNLRMFIDDKTQGFFQQLEDFRGESNGLGWPKDTWFRKRLEFVREQQRKKGIENELVYECSLGTISFRQRNGSD